MSRLALVFSVVCLAIFAASPEAGAGGWSGADGESQRAHFKRGYTLDKLWSVLGSR